MRFPLRIYRTHDYDLMALYYSGALSVGKAAKKALVSFYTGQPWNCQVTLPNRIPQDLPPSYNFILSISDADAPGIELWFNGLERGYKNNFIKTVLRSFFDRPFVELYRRDSWVRECVEHKKMETEPILKKVIERHEKQRPAKCSANNPKGDGERYNIQMLSKQEGKQFNPKGVLHEISQPAVVDEGFNAFEALLALH